VLGPLADEVVKLRQERADLEVTLGERRAKGAEAEGKAKIDLDGQLASIRKDEFEKLRDALLQERVKHETDLAQARAELTLKMKELRREQDLLLTEQLLLSEDKEGLTIKVKRLADAHTENLHHDVDALKKQLHDAREMRDDYFRKLESRGELDRRFGNQTPEQVLSNLEGLERERDDLAQQLRQRPDAGTAERLTALELEGSQWLEQRGVLAGDMAKAQAELATRRLAAIELETLRKQKEALEVHKQLLDGAVEELRKRVNELTRQDDHRNPMTALSSLDEDEGLQAEIRTVSPIGPRLPTLKDFATDLRHRIARGVPGRTLYYTDRDVRSFLGGLAMTRMMLLQGISGTGKTSLPLAFASAVDGGIEVVEVQAGWRDRQDLIGYYNAFHSHYYATNFLQALYKAGTPAFRDRPFLMVLDEINLSRPEQFFADFLSALEQPIQKRRLTLVNDPVTNAPRLMVDGRHLPIPPNVWFVGTANHDESTAEFADKTYDRAHVMEMPRITDAAHFDVEDKGKRNPISYADLDSAFTAAAHNQAGAVRKSTDWLRSAIFAKTLERRFRVGWGNRLELQIERYLPVVVEAGGTVGEAMDHLLVTKVLRKLKDRHDVRAAALESLQDEILSGWDKLDGRNPPARCIDLIESEIIAKNGEELV